MKKAFKLGKGYRIAYMLVLAAILIVAVLVAFYGRKEETVVYEPAPPEAPRLTSLGVVGYKIRFSAEKRYYEVEIPEGHPNVPMVWATCKSDIELEIYQATFAEGKNEAFARVLLNDGQYKNNYDIKFVKTEDEGFVLQYDDRYVFTPSETIKEGAKLTYTVDADGNNVTVDSNGVIRVTGVSDKKAVVRMLVNGHEIDSLTINRTEKAALNVYIVAGQGNASGEGGNAEESTPITQGNAYIVEINDRTNTLRDLSEGRQGFTPAIAEKLYTLTTQKSLFIQTAVSDVSIAQWTKGGEAYKMALERINGVVEKLNAEDSNYTLGRTICLWLQGEWDIAHNMASSDYIKMFADFHENLKNDTKTEMVGIIPVRSSLDNEGSSIFNSQISVAQYQIANMYDDVRLITRIPETATVENGFISKGNLYYTQKGYNDLGSDIAANIFNCYNADADRSPRAIEVIDVTNSVVLEYGETVRVDKNMPLRTSAVIAPLSASKNKISVSYDKKLITYNNEGIITISTDNVELEKAEVCFSCGNVEFRFNVEFYDATELPQKKIMYVWDFDSLNTTNGTNLLTISERSTEGGYILSEGVITSNERLSDFSLEVPITLTSNTGWDIEWSGSITDNGILLGNEYSNKGYIFLAPFAENMGYSVRIVDDNGFTLYLPYGENAQFTKEYNSWRINYNKENKTMTLYMNGLIVSKEVVEKDFECTLTNLFGRYSSESVNYCYSGSLDNLSVSIG